jgi:hypothetical protein
VINLETTIQNIKEKTPKLPKLRIESGKSEYHIYRMCDALNEFEPFSRYRTLRFYDEKGVEKIDELSVYEPCICEFNYDATPVQARGCISIINPYLRTGEEIISGSILTKPLDEILSRYDEVLEKQKQYLKQNHGLNPQLRYSKDFSEKLKENIFQILQELVAFYQKNYTAQDLNNYFNKLGLGLCDGKRTRCDYCYSQYNNNRQGYLVTDKFDMSDIEKKFIELKKEGEFREDINGNDRLFVRVGKNTESASLFNLHHLFELLNLGLKHDISFHIPTKFLPFEESIAKLLRETKSTLGYSFGYEHMETGAMLQGYDFDLRQQNAKKYADSGVITTLKISLDASVSFEESEKNKGQINRHIEFLKQNPNIRRQLIPMRMTKKLIGEITGKTQEELTTPQLNMFNQCSDVEPGSEKYSISKSNLFTLNNLHSDFLNFFKQDICGTVGKDFYCNSCHFDSMPNIKIEDEAKHLVKTVRTKSNRFLKRNTLDTKNQQKLFDTEVKRKTQKKGKT